MMRSNFLRIKIFCCLPCTNLRKRRKIHASVRTQTIVWWNHLGSSQGHGKNDHAAANLARARQVRSREGLSDREEKGYTMPAHTLWQYPALPQQGIIVSLIQGGRNTSRTLYSQLLNKEPWCRMNAGIVDSYGC